MLFKGRVVDAVRPDHRSKSLLNALQPVDLRILCGHWSIEAFQERAFKVWAPCELLVGQSDELAGPMALVRATETNHSQLTVVHEPVARLIVTVSKRKSHWADRDGNKPCLEFRELHFGHQ